MFLWPEKACRVRLEDVLECLCLSSGVTFRPFDICLLTGGLVIKNLGNWWLASCRLLD